VEPVERSVPKVLEASGPIPPATATEDEAGTAAVAAGTADMASTAAAALVLVPRPSAAASRSRSHLPLLVLNLPAFALGVESRVNQMVEVVETVVHECVLQVII
jgi:hypothetical protein